MSGLHNIRQWEPVTAPLQNRPGERSPSALRRVLEQFEVRTNPRYAPTATSTYCNIYVWDCTRALYAEIPHWVEDPKRRELNVNATMKWLEEHGKAHGWHEVDETVAVAHADIGGPAVAIWRNPNPRRSGHIAMLLPSRGRGVRIAQAGRRNLFDVTLPMGFGRVEPIRFFAHD